MTDGILKDEARRPEAEGNAIVWDIAPRAIELSIAAGAAGRRLVDMRSNAGPKSSRSAHQDLHEHALFQDFSDHCAQITRLLQDLLPVDWVMPDWGIRPSQTGHKFRWGNKGGRGHGGFSVSADEQSIALFLGRIVGLVAASRRGRDEDLRRMKELGLSPRVGCDFSLRSSLRFHHISAFTPSDAVAKLFVRGEITSFPLEPLCDRARDSFRRGLGEARSIIDAGLPWSAYPGLWDELWRSKVVTGLCGTKPKTNIYFPPWKSNQDDPETFDRALVAAVAICASIEHPDGYSTRYILEDGDGIRHDVFGWCGSSAILGHLVLSLKEGKPIADISDMRVFSLDEDQGEKARHIVANLRRDPARIEDA